MLFNYFKTAWRNLTRHRFFSLINLIGLSASMTLGLFIILLITDRLGYDRFHENKERIFRVNTDEVFPQGTDHYAGSPAILGDLLSQQYRDRLEAIVRFDRMAPSMATANGRELNIEGQFAQPALFDMLSLPLRDGDKRSALQDPYQIVISEDLAEKFFGLQTVLGKTIFIKNYDRSFLITGTVKTPKEKTRFLPDCYLSASTIPALQKSGKIDSLFGSADQIASHTYVMARKGTSLADINSQLLNLEKQINPLLKRDKEMKYHFYGQPFNEISPAKLNLIDDYEGGASVQSLYLYAGVALIILLLACFNYTNLSLARSLSRAKEIGVRKVNGATRWQIFTQFLVESVLFSLFSLVIACFLLQAMSGIDSVRELILQHRLSLAVWISFVLFSVLTGLIAGLLPAWILARFNPTQILKGLSGTRIFKGFTLRKILISIQFSASIIFIVVLLAMVNQTRYMSGSDYGFAKNGLINVALQGRSLPMLKNELNKLPFVETVAASSGLLGFTEFEGSTIHNINLPKTGLDYFSVDRNFLTTMKLHLVAGNNFPEGLSDSSERYIILNETALSALQLGAPTHAIGQTVFVDEDQKPLQVIGVVKDFNYLTKKMAIGMMGLRIRPADFRWLSIRVNNAAAVKDLDQIRAIWKKINPAVPIDAGLYEEKFSERHGHRDDVLTLFALAGLTLSLACLGIIGIGLYTAEEKKKEVAIRKILGAGVMQIVTLLSRNLALLVVISALLALPVGWMLANQLLQQYANRPPFPVWILPAAFGTIGFFALLSSGWQVVRSASANPSSALHDN